MSGLTLSNNKCCMPKGLSVNLALSGTCCTRREVTVTIPNTEPLRDLIEVASSNFADAIHWNGGNGEGVVVLASYNLKVFSNDWNKYLKEGVDWTRTATGLIMIQPSDFDAMINNYTFYIHISKV